MNATSLFEGNRELGHNSEDFWSSVFAIQVLEASQRGIELSVPLHSYKHDGDTWEFRPEGSLTIPTFLGFENVLVGSILRSETFPGLQISLDRDFDRLKPDLLLRLPDRTWIVETKTVGASIIGNERKYPELAAWLTDNDCPAEACFLVSAGYDKNGDWRLLAERGWKLILWEQFFKVVESQVPDALLTRLVPDLCDYYVGEDAYLSSNPGNVGK